MDLGNIIEWLWIINGIKMQLSGLGRRNARLSACQLKLTESLSLECVSQLRCKMRSFFFITVLLRDGGYAFWFNKRVESMQTWSKLWQIRSKWCVEARCDHTFTIFLADPTALVYLSIFEPLWHSGLCIMREIIWSRDLPRALNNHDPKGIW
jgi:hypothetical protein